MKARIENEHRKYSCVTGRFAPGKSPAPGHQDTRDRLPVHGPRERRPQMREYGARDAPEWNKRHLSINTKTTKLHIDNKKPMQPQKCHLFLKSLTYIIDGDSWPKG
ncbi:hypothetical protein [Pseudomonas sp. MWU13-2105]|uniref:hypothetical protein n=1 Tax=Pseudomonas sp. MWU13-2105 TaxID=2935074 RepID=UPI00200DF7DE|nr:hypothetical protein [Pseudomonas sp. MWU13-2105]